MKKKCCTITRKTISEFGAYKAIRVEPIMSEGRLPFRLLLPRYLKASQFSDA